MPHKRFVLPKAAIRAAMSLLVWLIGVVSSFGRAARAVACGAPSTPATTGVVAVDQRATSRV